MANGEKISAPTQPTRNHYTFDGWYKDASFASEWDFNSDVVNSHITLYAKWDQNEIRIDSVSNASIEGTEITMVVEDEIDEVDMNDTVVLNDTNATWKLCYDNLGQTEITSKIAVNSDSGVLSNGENVFYILVASADGMQGKVYTLKIYRKISVTVEYYDLDNDVRHTTKIDNNSTIYSPYRYNPTGYTVNGWYYYEGSEKVNFVFGENGTIVTNKTVLKLYPEATANTYEVTLSVGSGESVSESTVTVTYDSSKTFPIPQKEGYSFAGWYNVGTQVTNADGYCDNWDYARQVTLTPRWSINKYTLTLDKSAEGGSVTGGGEYNYNSEVTVTAKTYTGYTFTGWYDGETKLSAELSYTFNMPAENKTYTAKYAK